MPRSSPTPNWRLTLVLIVLAGGLAWLYRSSDLAKRPMHTDEAILAMKTVAFLKTDLFEYDPRDYHGPLLHYLARWQSQLLGWQPDTLNEERLRLVTAVFGMGLILIAFLLADALTATGAVIAALLIATSPMMTYYSRYYIMETPLVFFCGLMIASLWRWTQSRNALWLVIAGVSLGAMHAAKETFVLNLAAMAVGLVGARVSGTSFTERHGGYRFSEPGGGGASPAWLIVPAFAVLTSVALYSNFFQSWNQVRDSILTYQGYVHRSGGAGHAKPWHYYSTLLFWNRNPLYVWTEALIGGLALAGLLGAWIDRRRAQHHRAFLIFLGVYAFALLGIYSIIPYKTPWAVLAVDHALALLAGAGAVFLLRALHWWLFKLAFSALLVAGIYNLCRQTSLAIDYNKEPVAMYSAHDLNPYAYAHTSTRIPALARRIHDLAALHPDGLQMPVQIIQFEEGWPLGWYLRDMPHVGYHKSLPEHMHPPAVIIADEALQEALRSMFAPRAVPIVEPDPEFVGPPPPPPAPPPTIVYESDEPCNLRPGVVLAVLVERRLLEKLRAKEAAAR